MHLPREIAGPIALCVVLSVLAHAAVVLLIPSDWLDAPSRLRSQVELTVRLAQHVPRDQPPSNRQPPLQESPPVEAPAIDGDETNPAPAAVEPAAPAPDPQREALELGPMNPDAVFEAEQPWRNGPEALAFRPDLRGGVQQRREQQERQAVLDANRVHRGLGYDAGDTHGTRVVGNSFEEIVQIGETCYAVSARSASDSVQRGTPVAELDVCPGWRPWWRRDALDEVALYRGIP